MLHIFGDLKTGARSLVHRPGLALGIVLTIAVGIGATTTIYSVVDAVILRPLPYDTPESLVAVGRVARGAVTSDNDTGRQELVGLTSMELDGLRERARSFEALAAVGVMQLRIVEEDGSEHVLPAARVDREMFSILGVEPVVGRTFLPEEFRPGSSLGVILSHDYWLRRYGGDPAVLGRSIEWRQTAWAVFALTIVGVLPRGFHPPEAFIPEGDAPDLYLPVQLSRGAFVSNLSAVGRLAPGVTLEQAREEIRALSPELAADIPMPAALSDERERIIGVNDLYAETIGDADGSLWIFLGASGLLLALAVLNASTLLLARGLDRRQELDVRAALGAGRLRVASLLATEAIALSMIGGVVGVLAAYGGVEAFLRFAPASIPRVATVSVDGRVLAMAVGATMLAGLGSALVPALALARRSVWDGLQAGSRVISEPAGLLRTILVGAQLALAFVLLCGAGLLFSSFLRLRAADGGFEPGGLFIMSPVLSRPVQARSPAEYQTLWDDVLARLAVAPGLTAVAGASGLPFETPNWMPRVLLAEDPSETEREGIAGYAITPEFLRTMGIDVLRGRAFGPEDGSDAEPVALVNEAFVRTQLKGREPLGMILTRDVVSLSNFGPPERVTVRVVGVVEDVVQARLEDGPRAAVYIPYKQADEPQIIPWWIVVRSSRSPSSILTSELRASFDRWDVRPDGVTAIDERIGRTHVTPRFRTILLGAFAGVALLLSALGLYASIAHMVRRRQRELGVRMALGADRVAILRMVMRRGMLVSVASLAIGLVVTLATGRLLVSFLYEIEPYDPSTLLAVATLLLCVCATACLVPARKATAVDPVKVLQAE